MRKSAVALVGLGIGAGAVAVWARRNYLEMMRDAPTHLFDQFTLNDGKIVWDETKGYRWNATDGHFGDTDAANGDSLADRDEFTADSLTDTAPETSTAFAAAPLGSVIGTSSEDLPHSGWMPHDTFTGAPVDGIALPPVSAEDDITAADVTVADAIIVEDTLTDTDDADSAATGGHTAADADLADDADLAEYAVNLDVELADLADGIERPLFDIVAGNRNENENENANTADHQHAPLLDGLLTESWDDATETHPNEHHQ